MRHRRQIDWSSAKQNDSAENFKSNKKENIASIKSRLVSTKKSCHTRVNISANRILTPIFVLLFFFKSLTKRNNFEGSRSFIDVTSGKKLNRDRSAEMEMNWYSKTYDDVIKYFSELFRETCLTHKLTIFMIFKKVLRKITMIWQIIYKNCMQVVNNRFKHKLS